MIDKQTTKQKKVSAKRIGLIGLAVVLLLAVVGTGGFLLWENAFSQEGAGAEQLRENLADPKVEEVSVTGTVYLSGPLEISGTKTLLGDGKLKAAADWESGTDYMLVLGDDAELILTDSTVVDANGRCGGVYVGEKAQLSVSGDAKIRGAAEDLCNVMDLGSFTMEGGTLEKADGHNLCVAGEASLVGGSITGSGEAYAGVYVNGIVTQLGTVISDGYDNVYLADGASYQWSGGENNNSKNDGIYVAEGASLKSDSLSSLMSRAGKQGIHLYGTAIIDDIFLLESGENQIKIEESGHLTLNNGAFDASCANGITNRGTMIMSGGEITNSSECGIVCSGSLEITGGRVFASGEQGVLLRNGTDAVICGQGFSASSNSIGVVVEENATAEIYDCNINSNDLYNFSSYGELYLHDLTTGGSGSNCIQSHYGGHIIAEDITISGTVRNNGIYNVNGSTVELYNVTIDAAKSNGIRTLDATLIAEDLTITNCGGHGISMSDYELQGAGNVKIENLTMDGNGGANLSMEVDCSGTMEVTEASLGKTGSNNISAKGGHLILTDVDILGNIEKDASNHGILLDEHCKITAKNLLIQDTLKSGMRIRGGDFEGTNVTMKNLGLTGISSVVGITDKLCGNITINGLTITGAKENDIQTDCNGVIKITNGTLGKTWSNCVRLNKGTMTLTNVKVQGQTANPKSAQEHGFMIDGGTLIMNNVTIDGSKSAGIRHKGGVIRATDLTITNSGGRALSCSNGNISGSVTINNFTASGSKDNNIFNDSSNTITVNGGTLAPTYTNNVRINNGTVTLNDVDIEGQIEEPKSNAEHGIMIDGGKLNLKNVNIYDCVGAGIRHKGGEVVSTGVLTIKDSGGSALSCSNGNKEGSVTIETLNASGSGENNIFNDSTNTITVNGGTLAPTYTNNVRINNGTVTLNDVDIEGQTADPKSAQEHGIYIDGGSLLGNGTTITGAKSAGIRHRGGVVNVTNLTVNNSGSAGISSSDGSREGSMTIDGLKISGSGAQNIVNDSSMNITISNAELDKTTKNNNITINNGVVTLTEVTVYGTEGNSHHGLFVNGGTVNATALTIENAQDAVRIDGGVTTVTGGTLSDSRRHGINQSKGTLTVNTTNVTDSGENGIYLGSGEMTLNGITVDTTVSHGVLALGGTLGGNTVTVRNVPESNKSGVQVENDAIVNVAGLDVDCGRENLYIKDGDVTLTGANLSGAGRNGVSIGAGSLRISGSEVASSANSGFDIWGTPQVQMENVEITTPGKKGANITSGTVSVKNTQINSAGTDGITLADGTLSVDGLTVTAPGGNALVLSNGSLTGDNVTLQQVSKAGLTVNGGTMELDNVKINIAGTTAYAENNVMINDGNVTLKNLEAGKTTYGNTVIKGGQLTLNTATLHGTAPSVAAGHHGLHINGGSVIATNLNIDGARDAIRMEKGEATVTGGSLTNSKRHGVSAGSAGTLALTDVTISNTVENGITIYGNAEVSVSGGYIYATSKNAINNDNATLKLSAPTIGYDASGAAVNGNVAVKSKNPIIYVGSQEPAKNIVLDVTGKSIPTVLVSCESEAIAQALKDNFNLVGGSAGWMLLAQGKDLCVGGAVAQVGNKYFTSLETAVAAALSGSDKTVILLENVTVTQTIDITGQVIITDNGTAKTITRSASAVMFNVTGSLSLQGTAKDTLVLDGNNVASTGNVINVATGAALNVTNTKLQNLCSGTYTSAAIYAGTGSTLTMKDSTVTGTQGAVCYLQGAPAENTTHSFTGCTFEKNDAGSGAGAVLNGTGGYKATIYGCTFNENETTGHGGAIYLEKAELLIENSQFTGNSGNGGGAVTVSQHETSKLTVDNCDFNQNTANKGGAIWLRSADNTTVIKNSSFSGNTATNAGQAILADANTNLTVESTTFTGSAQQIYMDAADAAKHIFKGAVQADVLVNSGAIKVAGTLDDSASLVLGWNTVPTGEAIVFDSKDLARANADNISLTDALKATHYLSYIENAAYLVQGEVTYAAYIEDFGYATLEAAAADAKNGDTIRLVKNVTVTQTMTIDKTITITDDGTARTITRGSSLTATVFNVTGSLTLKGTGTNTLILDGANVSATKAAITVNAGAAVTVGSGTKLINLKSTGSTAVITTAGASGNVATVNVSGAVFDSNTGTVGGVCYFGNHSTGTIENSTFNKNTATSYGGAIYCENNSTVHAINSTFTNNNGTGNGGAFMLACDGNNGYGLTLTGCTVTGNTAVYGGGLYAWKESGLTLDGTTFSGNTATGTPAGNDIHFRMNGSDAKEQLTVKTSGSKSVVANIYFQTGCKGKVYVAGTLVDGSKVTYNWDSAAGFDITFDSEAAATANKVYIYLADSLRASYHLVYSGNMATVTEGADTAVARIGAAEYATLAAAIEAANQMQSATIILTADVTVDAQLEVSGNVTITDDGNAHSITSTSSFTGTMFNVTGSLTFSSTGSADVANGAATNAASKLTVNGNAVTRTAGAVVMNDGAQVTVNQGVRFTGFKGAQAVLKVGGKNGALTVNGGLFDNNDVGGGYCGTIGTWNNNAVSIKNAVFKNNSCTGGSAALYLNGDGTVEYAIDNCVFDGNTGNNGGAMNITGKAKVKITGCRFANNTNTNRGSAMFVEGTAVVTVDGCTFENNTGKGTSMTIRNSNCSVTVNGVVVSKEGQWAELTDEQLMTTAQAQQASLLTVSQEEVPEATEPVENESLIPEDKEGEGVAPDPTESEETQPETEETEQEVQ